MINDIEKILVSQECLYDKVKELGNKISNDYIDKDLVLVVVLKGSMIFAADLMRELSIPALIDCMAVSSYGNGANSKGSINVLKDLSISIENKSVLIIEDILDTGVTLSNLIKLLEKRNPESVSVCAMFDKPSRRILPVELKYSGFTVPDEFIVGYGLDYDEKYRNLPYVGVLKKEIYIK